MARKEQQHARHAERKEDLMIDFLVMGALKLFFSVFGLFIIIGIAYSVMAGRKVNHVPMVQFIGGLVTSVVQLVYQLCGYIGQLVAGLCPPRVRRSVSHLVQVGCTVVLIAVALAAANIALPPHGPINPGNTYVAPTNYNAPAPVTPAPQFQQNNPFPEARGLAPYTPPYERTPNKR
jgi:hypothetical protein